MKIAAVDAQQRPRCPGLHVLDYRVGGPRDGIYPCWPAARKLDLREVRGDLTGDQERAAPPLKDVHLLPESLQQDENPTQASRGTAGSGALPHAYSRLGVKRWWRMGAWLGSMRAGGTMSGVPSGAIWTAHPG